MRAMTRPDESPGGCLNDISHDEVNGSGQAAFSSRHMVLERRGIGARGSYQHRRSPWVRLPKCRSLDEMRSGFARAKVCRCPGGRLRHGYLAASL
jgi:hypothetical protein